MTSFRLPLIAATAGVTVAASLGLALPVLATPLDAVRTQTVPALAPPVLISVTNVDDSGPGSLRAGITATNALPDDASAVISFGVNGIISLASALPEISSHVIIDATTAPGYSDGGPPVVELNSNGNAGVRFVAGSENSQLLGFAIGNATGPGVAINAKFVTVNLNYIGLHRTGTAAGNTGDGVFLDRRSARTVIGLNPNGIPGAFANVISANGGTGIKMVGSSNNTVVSNRIGTDPTGSSALPNLAGGIAITDRSHRNTIGGTLYVDPTTGQANNPTGSENKVPAVYVVPPLGNQVSGNNGHGIVISSGSELNMLNGNFVGTTSSGNARLGNQLDGVRIAGANRNTLQGCKVNNDPFVYYNVLSGNGGHGLHVTNSNNVTIQANFFGIGANNTTMIPNRFNGMLFDGSSAHAQVGGVIPLGNVTSGNGLNGIELRDRVTNFLSFNTFAGLLAFRGPAPNGNNGVLVSATGGRNVFRTNVFSGNLRNGIELTGSATGVTIDPNIVGLTTNGRTLMPNGANGLLIGQAAHNNTIGGTRRSVIPQNLFSGNTGFGIAIIGKAHHNQILDTFIGTAVFGGTAAPNRRGGVLIGGQANHNTIGSQSASEPGRIKAKGEIPRPSNLISGNLGNGVSLTPHTHSNLVINNYVGLNRLRLPLPNSARPIVNLGSVNGLFANSTS